MNASSVTNEFQLIIVEENSSRVREEREDPQGVGESANGKSYGVQLLSSDRGAQEGQLDLNVPFRVFIGAPRPVWQSACKGSEVTVFSTPGEFGRLPLLRSMTNTRIMEKIWRR